MNTGEVVAICLAAAVGTYIVMSVMARTPASVKFPLPQSAGSTPISKNPRANASKKMPWAVGDVAPYDSEDPNYCGNCKRWCDSSFFEGHSTQCDQCRAACPGVRND